MNELVNTTEPKTATLQLPEETASLSGEHTQNLSARTPRRRDVVSRANTINSGLGMKHKR